jgi:hypothetical protein
MWVSFLGYLFWVTLAEVFKSTGVARRSRRRNAAATVRMFPPPASPHGDSSGNDSVKALSYDPSRLQRTTLVKELGDWYSSIHAADKTSIAEHCFSIVVTSASTAMTPDGSKPQVENTTSTGS